MKNAFATRIGDLPRMASSIMPTAKLAMIAISDTPMTANREGLVRSSSFSRGKSRPLRMREPSLGSLCQRLERASHCQTDGLDVRPAGGNRRAQSPAEHHLDAVG